ncbi:outer membrane usher protein FasD [Polaromonas sp.]|nr:outer membrane usher protein FasD [Polaromonas sp.]
MIKVVLVSSLLAPALVQAQAAGERSNPAPLTTPAAASRGGSVHLEVELNGMASGLVHFGWRNGELWASADTLRKLGFILPASTDQALRLNSLPGLSAIYDVENQKAILMAKLSLLDLPTTQLGQLGGEAPVATASPGALLNYDVYGTSGQQGSRSLSAFTELRAFSGTNVISSTSLTQAQSSDQSGWKTTTKRLDTTLSHSDQEKMLTLRVGDTLTGALPWTRATRIGGIQLSTNFALQPYRRTAPLPSFIGSATLPSDVELYVDGLRQYSGKVPPGPFQLNTIPNISGSGNAQMVVTDTLGQATTLNFSLYDTQRLLQKGLADWTIDFGVVRKNYGLNSFDYRREPAASGTLRYGLTDTFTFETHAEATTGLALAGAGGVWQMGAVGDLSGAVAHSRHRSSQGSQLNVGYNWRNKGPFNFSLNATGTQGDYRDIGSKDDLHVVRRSGSAALGYSSQNFGSVGLSYLHLRYADQPLTRLATLYWFKSIGRSASLNLSVNQSLETSSERSIFFGLNMTLDDNIALSGGLQRDKGRSIYNVDASSSAPSEGGIGWRTGLRHDGSQTGAQGQLDYLGRYGRVGAGISAVGDSRNSFASVNGGLVFMGGQTFATQRVNDAFAVVSTNGVADVPVQLSNRTVGTTDSKGMLLISPLRGYQKNDVGIDPMQLPPDMRIDRVSAQVTPTDRAGTLVHFGITPVRAALITLVDAAGKPLPVGSLVRQQGVSASESEQVVVGFAGETYLDTLELTNVLDVETPEGVCRVSFDYPEQASGIPRLGPLNCLKESVP